MPDIRTAPLAPHTAIRREDYRPPDWLVPSIAIDFDLTAEKTRVRATLMVERNGDHDRPLRLDGDELTARSVRVDGVDAAWTMEGPALVVEIAGDRATVETEVELVPRTNSKLMGLYESGGILCTQCESEGFRRISFFPDRPDVLSRYRVRMTADRARFPVLLANGNLVAEGHGDDGLHWAEWEDPFPKPSYLFALVAGDLKPNRDRFTTASGREVDLAIWVREPDLAKTGHAMASLEAAMAWDERVYGREYDLDRFNIVAVDDFNFGAMENKGLNIFNSRYVLADAETASDGDFDAIAAVVAHEYFHNWSGDRVTCRDWFQLSLKEGFTVFRDQNFSADMGSAAVERIDQVRMLRAAQFPEDAGPLAHPVRPDSYIEITNFYTATVYNKGAELIRMMRTILGPENFRAGTDLYFDRHDGQAVTCDDFVAALEDASGVDLTQFRLWYSQAGTPRVGARVEYDAARRHATLHLTQQVPPTPGQADKAPMPVPLKIALVGEASGAIVAPERLAVLDAATATVEFDDIEEQPLLSINRDFSAPVIVTTERRQGELERLAVADDDPFARYEAMQELMLGNLLAALAGGAPSAAPVIDAVRSTLASNALDPAFKAEAVLLPSESYIADRLDIVDPDAIHSVRDRLRGEIGRALGDEIAAAYAACESDPASLSPRDKGLRRLRSAMLGYLIAVDPVAGAARAKAQFDGARTMTERQSALAALSIVGGSESQAALDAFYTRFRGDSLVIDKWFGLQGAAPRADTADAVAKLLLHPDFTLANPNRLRALVGSFAVSPFAFHRADGQGYRIVADTILAVDPINPQTAARLVPPLGRWRRYKADLAAMMRAQLERIAAAPGLSKDVYEQASKSLSG